MSATNGQFPEATNGLYDIKPPVEIVGGWESLKWVLIALAVLGAVAALVAWLLLRRKERRAAAPPEISPHARARQELLQALGLIGQPKPFCTAVSNAIRVYLEARFQFHAPERTTEEFLNELRNTHLLLPDQKDSLGDFLKRCDLVKFARYEPREAELRDLHDSAMRLVDETEPPPPPETRNPKLESAAP
jgi:hypothetical protein